MVVERDNDEYGLGALEEIAHAEELGFGDVVPEVIDDRADSGPSRFGGQHWHEEEDFREARQGR